MRKLCELCAEWDFFEVGAEWDLENHALSGIFCELGADWDFWEREVKREPVLNWALSGKNV